MGRCALAAGSKWNLPRGGLSKSQPATEQLVGIVTRVVTACWVKSVFGVPVKVSSPFPLQRQPLFLAHVADYYLHKRASQDGLVAAAIRRVRQKRPPVSQTANYHFSAKTEI
ncbi:hypothetical protein Q31a_54160 [Aureliella helgolandensis]|uniref:Uncharacterized protein n=1 Tax=Aureliella helgolandensis TaxID=2527968 RepID=A0A518GEL0_9BACT|nr:hypothetical protein Q31a_54160 [Aureliella helgolandensis]